MNTTACVLALALCGPIASVMPSAKSQNTHQEQVNGRSMTMAQANPAQANPAPNTSLTAAQATKTAQQLLDAFQTKDAAGLYAGLSDPLRLSLIHI